MMTALRPFPLATLALLAWFACFAGCAAVGPNYGEPDAKVPDAWAASVGRDLRGGASDLDKWWGNFNDARLTRLIEKVRASNPDVRLAAERIEEARSRRGIARSQLFPAANAGGDYVRNRASESLLFPAPGTNPSNLFSAGFDAGWEVDVFGGIRRGVEAAEAGIGVSQEAYRDVVVTLYAETAVNYIEYRTLEERIRLASANIKGQADSLELASARLEAGLASDLDVAQAETNLATSKALLPLLESQRAFAANRLAALAGGFPGSPEARLGTGSGIPVPKRGFSAGLPADLVRSRPDIRRAERELAAQTARIGVATAELYPKFRLAGDFTLQAAESGDFFQGASRAYAFGPSFRWNIFSAGQIRNTIRAEESGARQAYAAYEGAVIRGVEEVESAMAAIAHEWDRKAQLDIAVGFSRKTVGLVKQKYTEGLVDFQNVIDAERTLFDNDDNAAISRGAVARNYVILYKALGGGTEVVLEVPEATGKKGRRGEIPTGEVKP